MGSGHCSTRPGQDTATRLCSAETLLMVWTHSQTPSFTSTLILPISRTAPPSQAEGKCSVPVAVRCWKTLWWRAALHSEGRARMAASLPPGDPLSHRVRTARRVNTQNQTASFQQPGGGEAPAPAPRLPRDGEGEQPLEPPLLRLDDGGGAPQQSPGFPHRPAESWLSPSPQLPGLLPIHLINLSLRYLPLTSACL